MKLELLPPLGVELTPRQRRMLDGLYPPHIVAEWEKRNAAALADPNHITPAGWEKPDAEGPPERLTDKISDIFDKNAPGQDKPMGQTFNPADGPPRMPEDMVPFYESYIPVALEDEPEKIPAAEAALKARDQVALEKILNPWTPSMRATGDQRR
jgi:hypothetical protein